MAYRTPEERTQEINRQLKIGTVIMKESYYVDLWRVVAVEDYGDHWRGKDNLAVLVVPIHDTIHGFFDLPLELESESRKRLGFACPWLNQLPKVNGEPVNIQQADADLVHSWDIANDDVVRFRIFAKDDREAIAKYRGLSN